MKIIFVISVYVNFCGCARILGVFNHPGGSHTFLGKVLLKNLALKGHEVVMVSSFPMKEKVSNYRDIVLPELLEDLQRRNAIYFNSSKGASIQELKNMTLQHTEDTFKNPQVQQLLKSTEPFDVIIIDWFYNEATLIFGHVFKAPVIYMSSFGNMALLTDLTGNVLPYSYVPGAATYMSDDMSFKHRLMMTLFNIIYALYIPRRNKAHYEILKRHFENPPSIEKLQENVALVLSNSHFSFETPRPYTPNIIPVGGLHIEHSKKMPRALRHFLDDAEEGVVYFSLGSQIKSSNFNKKNFQNIIAALSKIPYKVLWKFENEEKINLPKNVKVVEWAPQSEVLAHSNVKLFITHGGILSFIEAIYHGVPLICIPFNGDQLTNAAFIVSRNIGHYISSDDIKEDVLFNSIQEVINNPKYQHEINYRSSLLRDQPSTPLDLAIFWVEHVIKHGHGHHLKTFATKLPFYKYYLIDVIFVIVCTLVVTLGILVLIIKTILSKILEKKKIKLE